MANPEHLAILGQGVNAWNEYRRTQNPKVVDPSGAELTAMNFCEADFGNVNLRGADLSFSHLSQADLRNANLRNTLLQETRFSDANLTGADLSGANLTMTVFDSADLRDADFTNAEMFSAIFSCVALDVVKGLETVVHKGPSTIGVDTFVISRGDIPEKFLRGIGLVDAMQAAKRFYSCFISYSTRDQDFAKRLYADLQSRSVRWWFAVHDVQGGRKLHEQIDQAIRMYDKLLLILSEHSMRSEWVTTEISKARKRELRDKTRVLFPISLAPFEAIRDWECFDADTGKDSAREIREYYIPDFSNWKDHDSYQKAFERLLKDLSTATARTSDYTGRNFLLPALRWVNRLLPPEYGG